MKIAKTCNLIGVLVLLLVGFSLSSCTKPGETTAVAAATGGAIGAGVGAVVGNQTGSTGTGFVVGAIAGSGAGAAVGNALEAQEEAIRQQDEAIERQDRVIAAQRSEIDDLRRQSQDRVSFKDDLIEELEAGSAVNRQYGNRQYGNNSRIREQTVSERAALRPFEDHTEVMKKSPNPRLPRMKVQNDQIPALEPVLKQGHYDGSTYYEQPASGSLKERTITVTSKPPTIDNQLRYEGVAPGTIQKDISKVNTNETQVLADTKECQEAAREVNTAKVAEEMSDKLFHYRRALRLCPTQASFHNDLGEVYVSLKRFDDARYEFAEALKLDPNYSIARNNLDALPNRY